MRLATLAAALALIAPACSKKKTEEGEPEPAPESAGRSGEHDEPLVRTDLSSAGIEATIEAPRGAEVSESLGAVRISGEHFGLEVSRGAADLAAIVDSWKEDEVNPLKELVTEEPDLVVAETELLGRREYHFAASVGGFTCQDQRERQWTRAEIERMVAACRSLEPDGQ